MSLANVHTETVTTLRRLKELSPHILGTSLVAVDSETNGLKRFRKPIGFSFATSANFGFYVPTLIWNGTELVSPWAVTHEVDTILASWLADTSKKWIGHNIQFDDIVVHNKFGFWITDNVYSDTQLLHHTVVSEEAPHGLKPLSVKFIGPDADQSQKDLEEDVKSKGGKWSKEQKDFYMADPLILGKYAAMDAILTYRLHELWYPLIEEKGLQKLWYEEVLPLNKVVTELNSVGVRVDIPYFKQLRIDTQNSIVTIEDEIYELIKDDVAEYEWQRIQDDVKVTARSILGKELLKQGFTLEGIFENEQARPVIENWYKNKNNIQRIFNLDSGDDKAFLLYEIMGFKCPKKTKSGKPAVDKKTLDLLFEEGGKSNEVIDKIKLRAKQRKLLSTYIDVIISESIDGRMYFSFRQVGTTSGRFSCGDPFNMQTLPRQNVSIKQGFITDEGYTLIETDYSSLEARIFSALSTDPELQKIYKANLDFYSSIAIDTENLVGYSAAEGDANFLKEVAPEKRQGAKEYALGLAYGMRKWKLSKVLGISTEAADNIITSYFKKFSSLRKFMDSSINEMIETSEVGSLGGRKRRATLIPLIQKHFPRTNIFSDRELNYLYIHTLSNTEFVAYYDWLGIEKPKTAKDFSYQVRKEMNLAVNHKIQSTAASLVNTAAIDFYKRRGKLDARIVSQVHDSLVMLVKNEDVAAVKELTRDCMENNSLAKQIVVPMVANPVCGNNLAETK